MNVGEAVIKRQSIRAFKPDPVPPDILKKILEAALHAPSSGNSQPCEYAVVSGTKLADIKAAVLAASTQMPKIDIPISMNYPEPWGSRYAALMHGVQEKLDISREDKQKRADGTTGGCKCGALLLASTLSLTRTCITQVKSQTLSIFSIAAWLHRLSCFWLPSKDWVPYPLLCPYSIRIYCVRFWGYPLTSSS